MDLMVGGHCRWEVLWVVVKGKKKAIFVKEFDNDLTAAIDLYYKAKRAERPFATLRCKNVAFPPPKKYQPYIEVERKKIKKNGRIRVVKTEFIVTPMTVVNHRGVVWCPYCREMRRFIRQDAFRFDGILVPKAGYYCICGISSENGMVRKFNPNPPMVPRRTRRVSASKRRSSEQRKGHSRK